MPRLTTPPVNTAVQWDDGVVFVFSFSHQQVNRTCGIFHNVISVQSSQGVQTFVSQLLQSIQQGALQVSADPQTWIETVKNASRGTTNNQIVISYDDNVQFPYTPAVPSPPNFQLQFLYSLAG
jgi:hypothetical protein